MNMPPTLRAALRNIEDVAVESLLGYGIGVLRIRSSIERKLCLGIDDYYEMKLCVVSHVLIAGCEFALTAVVPIGKLIGRIYKNEDMQDLVGRFLARNLALKLELCA